MVKFTLKLSDYLDQYQQNVDEDLCYCPVCYQQECTGNIEEDVAHIIDCYKNQAIELEILHHMDKTGDIPDIDELFVENINRSVEDEIYQISIKRKKHL